MTNFAYKLRLLMDERGLIQRDISEMIKCTEATVCHWFTQDMIPRRHMLLRLSNALDVPIEYFTDNAFDFSTKVKFALSQYTTEELLLELLRREKCS